MDELLPHCHPRAAPPHRYAALNVIDLAAGMACVVALGALVLGTVGWQAWRATSADPVKSLRHE